MRSGLAGCRCSLVQRFLPRSENSRFDNERERGMSSSKQRKHAIVTMTPPLPGLDFPN